MIKKTFISRLNLVTVVPSYSLHIIPGIQKENEKTQILPSFFVYFLFVYIGPTKDLAL